MVRLFIKHMLGAIKTIMWEVFPVHNELITSAGLSIIISKWRLIIDFKDHYQFPVLVQTHCNNYITICHCLCTRRLAISAITFTKTVDRIHAEIIPSKFITNVQYMAQLKCSSLSWMLVKSS